jgi:hypothetical protein
VDSESGSNDNSGKSFSAAWNSISKINSFRFKFGDTISFKCGERFSGDVLYPPCAGLTFNNYGTGDRPVIDGLSTIMCCDIGNKSNLTFNGIKFVNGTSDPGGEVGLWGAHDIIFESCNIDSGVGDNYYHSNLYAGGHCYNITVRNSTISYGQNNTSSFDGCLGFYADGINNLLMEYDTLIGNFSNIRIAFGDGNMTTNSVVRYCVARNGRWDNVDDDGSLGIYFYYNVFETSSTSNSNNLYFYCDGSEDYNDYAPRRSNYYNNTFICHGRNNHILVNLNGTGVDSNTVFENNIFYSDGTGSYLYECAVGYIQNWTFNNNLYFGLGGWFYHGINYTNLTNWKNLGFDSFSIKADPKFSDYANGDYSILIGSPAISNGVYVGLTRDIIGNSVPIYLPDIGAYQHVSAQNVQANIKVILEGMYNKGSMSTFFNSSKIIPLSQPFNSSPWNYSGSEYVSKIPAYVVDWIMVELRSTTPNYSLISRRAGFLKADGSIVDLDGTSALRFSNLNSDNYYIVIKYLNTIETWSKDGGESFNNSIISYDFTSSQSQAYGNNLVLKESKWCIYSGDSNQDGYIDKTDNLIIDYDNNNFTYHSINDLNGDGMVDLSDLIISDRNLNNHISRIIPPGAYTNLFKTKSFH